MTKHGVVAKHNKTKHRLSSAEQRTALAKHGRERQRHSRPRLGIAEAGHNFAQAMHRIT